LRCSLFVVIQIWNRADSIGPPGTDRGDRVDP
jgi:hypothetical protein